MKDYVLCRAAWITLSCPGRLGPASSPNHRDKFLAKRVKKLTDPFSRIAAENPCAACHHVRQYWGRRIVRRNDRKDLIVHVRRDDTCHVAAEEGRTADTRIVLGEQ